MNSHWEDWCWSSNTLATWCEELTHWKRPWSWERLNAGGEGDDRGWDGWMASWTWWTWVWANSGRWWRTGKPGVLQSMRLQRAGHNWAERLNNNCSQVLAGARGIFSFSMWHLVPGPGIEPGDEASLDTGPRGKSQIKCQLPTVPTQKLLI